MWLYNKKEKALTRKIILEKSDFQGANAFDSIKSDMANRIIPTLISEMESAGINLIKASYYGSDRWDIKKLTELMTSLRSNPRKRMPIDSHSDAEQLVSFVDNLISRTTETKELAEKFRKEAKRIHEDSLKFAVAN